MVRGRKPLPTTLKLHRGNPGKRPRAGREPSPQRGIPDPPTDLSAPVRAVWDKVGPFLDGMGVLTRADGLALLALCRAAADFLAFCTAVPVGDDVLTGAKKATYWNMKAAARDKAEARLLKLMAEFGLTPSSRARLAVAAEPTGGTGKAKYFA